MSGTLRVDLRRYNWALAPAFDRARHDNSQLWERGCAIFAILALLVAAWPALFPAGSEMAELPPAETKADNRRHQSIDATGPGELLVAGYVGNPIYYRSNVRLIRPDGTDLELKGLGWDGDALHFPIDGGVRAVRWGDRFGVMVDYLHNKAIARLGKGAHGRKLKYPVIEEVEASGTFKGAPAPKRIKLTDIFDRLEFTHGHNMLFLTGMMKLARLTPGLRPYVGLGAGFAIPHTEVWFAGEKTSQRTNEYQYAGPAVQGVFGVEFQTGRMSYFVEYKFSYAWISGALTTDESSKNYNVPGDLWRQAKRWWRGGESKHGKFSTTLGAHQILAGAGYRWSTAPAP